MTFKNYFFSLALAAALFLAPINLFFKWGESQAYVGGIFTDYLVQKLWLAEIPVLLIIALWFTKIIQRERLKIPSFFKKNALWLVVLLSLAVRQYFSPLPATSWWYFTKLIELILFGLALTHFWPRLHMSLVRYALLITIVFQAGIATLQFVRQQPLFEYQVLGETQLTATLNIARAQFKTGQMILPYCTTAHPNILAGVVVIFGALWFQLRSNRQYKLPWQDLLTIGIISWVVFLTQSVSALLALLLFLFSQYFSQFKKYFLTLAISLIIAAPIVLMFLSEQWQTESTLRRVFLNAHATSVIFQQPVFGTGLGLFTSTLAHITSNNFSQFIRFIQPVHHIVLLWLAETGLLGITFLWLGVSKLKFSNNFDWLLILAPLISLDHYLLTQWVGGVMMVLLINQAIRQHRSLGRRNE